MKHLIFFQLAAHFACSVVAFATPPTKAEIEVSAPKTWKGNWDWPKDDDLAENHSKLTIKGSAGNGHFAFVYTYAGKDYELQGKIGQTLLTARSPHPGLQIKQRFLVTRSAEKMIQIPIDLTPVRFMPGHDRFTHVLECFKVRRRIPVTELMIRNHRNTCFEKLS